MLFCYYLYFMSYSLQMEIVVLVCLRRLYSRLFTYTVDCAESKIIHSIRRCESIRTDFHSLLESVHLLVPNWVGGRVGPRCLQCCGQTHDLSFSVESARPMYPVCRWQSLKLYYCIYCLRFFLSMWIGLLHFTVILYCYTILHTYPCSSVTNTLGRHVQWSVTQPRSRVQSSVRACLPSTKELFQILPTHTMNREIIPGQEKKCVFYNLCPLLTSSSSSVKVVSRVAEAKRRG